MIQESRRISPSLREPEYHQSLRGKSLLVTLMMWYTPHSVAEVAYPMRLA